MSRIYEGEEWKHVRETEEEMTRAQQQSLSNSDYALGKISREQWSTEFDRLSNIGIQPHTTFKKR